MTDSEGDTHPMTAPSTTTATRFIQLKDVAETLNISAPQTGREEHWNEKSR